MADNKARAILGLLAETPVHAGAGSSLGVVDLPIQRAKHTQWPCIYGSSLRALAIAQRVLARIMD